MANTIQHGDAQNMLGNPAGVPNYSRFQLKGHRFTTEIFGLIDVCGVYNGIEADKIDWKPSHEIASYTLNAPLMQPIFKEKDYILVTRQAILPFNWDKIHVQPNIGDDIDATEYGTSVKNTKWRVALNLYNKYLKTANSFATPEDEESAAVTLEAMRFAFMGIILGEYFFSYGSLLTKLGASFASAFKDIDNNNYDTFFNWAADEIVRDIKAMEVQFGDDVYKVNIGLGKEYLDDAEITYDEFLDRVRENPGGFEITKIYGVLGQEIDTTDSEWSSTADRVQNVYNQVKTINILPNYSKPVDIARLWAYQLAVAEYMTNSHVDYIYSAELFRQLVCDTIAKVADSYGDPYVIPDMGFTYNGLHINADYLCAKYFTWVGDIANSISTDTSDYSSGEIEMWQCCINYYSLVFAFRRSLKYCDYFTGSKTRPLAVGDVTINPDLGGKINVVDISRKGQAYRFLNAVNRIGRKAEDYTLEIMGVKQRHDWHVPLWIGSTRSAVNAEITDNTGEAQMTEELSQTSRLYGQEGRYKFEFDLDRDAIIIGLTYYDIQRSYGNGVERSFMHVDRYDMYNPYLQYTGDQVIYGEEYDVNGSNPFGYVPAYEEFKQTYNKADGGFLTSLPGYAFVNGLMYNRGSMEYGRRNEKHIGPDFIRSKPVELDRFYKNLTGHSLGTKFHFIIDYYNEINAKRRMAFNPGVAL